MVVGANKMNMCVFGLWHLGSVTAARLAKLGYNVVGLDFDNEVIENLMTLTLGSMTNGSFKGSLRFKGINLNNLLISGSAGNRKWFFGENTWMSRWSLPVRAVTTS